jgi:quercetin dioxygenase-like cupin family protein
MVTNNKIQGKIITKAFYQKATSPVLEIPDQLLHENVEQIDAIFDKGPRPPFYIVDLPSKTMCMTIGSLEPNGKSGKHRHSYETIMFITEGEGYTMIEDRKVEWKKGDAVFVPVWTWHFNVNTSKTETAKYVSCDNAPLLHTIGLAMFEPEL